MTTDAPGPDAPRLEDLRKAAQAFESVVARMLMNSTSLLDERVTEGTSTLGIARRIVARHAKSVSTSSSPVASVDRLSVITL
jgi:hypothetical protein